MSMRVFVEDGIGLREFREVGTSGIDELPKSLQTKVIKHNSMAHAYTCAERIHGLVITQKRSEVELAHDYGITRHFVKKIVQLWEQHLDEETSELRENFFNESQTISDEYQV